MLATGNVEQDADVSGEAAQYEIGLARRFGWLNDSPEGGCGNLGRPEQVG